MYISHLKNINVFYIAQNHSYKRLLHCTESHKCNDIATLCYSPILCVCVCVCVCLFVCVTFHLSGFWNDNSKSYRSRNMKFENMWYYDKQLGKVGYWALSDQGEGQCRPLKTYCNTNCQVF